MKEKQQAKLEASCGREGFGFNSAYAFSDRFSVMLNGFSVFNNSTEYARKYNIQAEAALGYYKTFQDSFHYETFIGFSRGWLNSGYERPVSEFSRNLDRGIFNVSNSGISFPFTGRGSSNYPVNGYGTYYTAFMQHSFGFGRTRNNWNSFSWTFRAQYVKFDQYREDILTGNNSNWYKVNVPEKILIQPVLTDKIGLSNRFMLSINFGLNFDVSKSEIKLFSWNDMFCYAGLEFSFHRKTSKPHVYRSIFPQRFRKNMFQKGY